MGTGRRTQTAGGRELLDLAPIHPIPDRLPCMRIFMSDLQQFLEPGARYDHGLRAFRTGGHAADLDARALLEEPDVIAGGGGKFAEARKAARCGFPAGEVLVDGLDVFHTGEGCGHFAGLDAVNAIRGTHRNLSSSSSTSSLVMIRLSNPFTVAV